MRRRSWLTALGCLALGWGILAFDLEMPAGVAVGSLYCAVVLNTIWARDARTTVAFSLFASGLVVVGWLLSPSGNHAWMGMLNRVISLSMVWLCAGIILSRLISGAHLQMAMEAAPAGMIVLNRRGRILQCNGEAGRIFGATHGDLRLHDIRELVRMPSGAWAACLEACILGGDNAVRRRREAEGVGRDGRRFPAEFDAVPIRREIGSLVLIMIRDLTDERRRDRANERLAAIVRSSRDAIVGEDLEGRITDWNPGAETVYGYTAEEAFGRHVSFLVPPSYRSEVDEILDSVRAEQDAVRRTKRLTKAGLLIDVDLRVSPIFDRQGRVIGASATARDMTKEREAERLLLEVNTALSHAMPGMIQVDEGGRVVTANPEALGLTGKSEEELLGRPWTELVREDERAEAARALEAASEDGSGSLTIRSTAADESFLELFLVRRMERGAGPVACHVFLRDVTERARSEAEARALASELEAANHMLDRQASVDPLTGLLNRRGLHRHIRHLAQVTRRPVLPLSVIFVDLDDFKAINDRHGHAIGDRVLVRVAQLLTDALRGADPVARIGGDEFLVLLAGTGVEEAGHVAERMRASMAAAPMPMLGEGARVTCSIGVAPVERGEITIETALQAARGQLSRSKSAGKDRVCQPEPRQESDHAARELVAGRGLRAFHQPIYDLLENRIAGYELLTRGPQGAYERPAEFLPLLGSGSDLTRFDLECLRVCAEAARRMPPTACLHFNLFPSTLLEVGAEAVLRVLERAGTDRVTCIELNERGIPGDSPQLREHVALLKRAGVQLAIDDVGFGSSSLEALLYLEPEVIKIDHACVEAPDCARILERLLGVAGVLRARVIAEGVSDEEILARLVEKRVRFGQGFLWGHPEAVLRGEKPWPLPRRRVAAAQRAAATDESQSVPLSKET